MHLYFPAPITNKDTNHKISSNKDTGEKSVTYNN